CLSTNGAAGGTPFNVFDASLTHKAALLYSRPICTTRHKSPFPQHTKTPGRENRRLCLPAPTPPGRWNRGAPQTLANKGGARSNEAIIHPRVGLWYKLG